MVGFSIPGIQATPRKLYVEMVRPLFGKLEALFTHSKSESKLYGTENQRQSSNVDQEHSYL
jgi:hypothetical protein